MKLRDTRVGRTLEALSPLRVGRFVRDLWSNGRAASKESGVSLLRIGAEQVALYVQNRLARREYYMYSLQDPELSWSEKRAFISFRYNNRYRDVLTPRCYAYLFKNKLAFARYSRGASLPVAKLYGVFDPVVGQTANGAPLRCADDLRALLETGDFAEFVIKPVESLKGYMVLPLRRNSKTFESARGEGFSCQQLVGYMADPARLREAYPDTPNPPTTFLLEERLRPHAKLRCFTKETLCSTRVVTLVKSDGEVDILGAAFKLPGEDRGVDNLSQGGLCIGVELESGSLMEGVFYQSVPPTRYKTHPITGKDFYGFVLPIWDEVKALAVRAALEFPMVRAIGWDVAMTDRGAVLIEGNNGWAFDIIQQAYHKGLLQDSFKATYEAVTHASFGG